MCLDRSYLETPKAEYGYNMVGDADSRRHLDWYNAWKIMLLILYNALNTATDRAIK